MTEEICPRCEGELRGLATFCQTCEEYVEDMGQKVADPEPTPAAAVVDTRLEDARRFAIRKALELIPGTPDWPQGFVVVDLEQNRKGTRIRKGIADLYVMGFGVSAWGEIKTDKGKQRPEQVAFEADCQACGIPYFVWRNEEEALLWALDVRSSHRSAGQN